MRNNGVFIGHNSRLINDECNYKDQVSESVGPMMYKLSLNQINNHNSCLSVLGPRPSTGPNSYGVSTMGDNSFADSQQLVDIESVLSNRNTRLSKDGGINDINVNDFRLKHARTCNDFLDPIDTHLTNSP